MAVNPIPAGYPVVSPYLVIQGAAKAIDYYKKVFNAVERMRMPGPGGKVMHAELTFGESLIMLADEAPEMGFRGPRSFGGSGVCIHLFVRDVDAVFAKAIAEGAKQVRPPMDQFYGDRSATVEDPFGHLWSLATHKEDVSPAEMQRRFEEMMKKGPGGQ